MKTRKVLFLAAVFLLWPVVSGWCGGMFAGILYPKKIFDFYQQGDTPPSAAPDRLEAGNKYPQVFGTVFIHRGIFKYIGLTSLFVKEPCRKVVIYELSYEYDEGNGVFYQDKVFNFTDDSTWRTNGEWYWDNFIFRFGNFEKVFKGKKPGDVFPFTLTIRYSVDDGEEQTEVLHYEVETIKGEYQSPFFGWW